MSDRPSQWRATTGLARALSVGGAGVAVALVVGRPALVVLVAPLLVTGALGLLHKPRQEPRVHATLAHGSLHEGQGTRSRLTSSTTATSRWSPASWRRRRTSPCTHRPGRSAPSPGATARVEISPRRWGRRMLGAEKVALTSPWAGYRWGPASMPGREMFVLPTLDHLRSVGEAPQPIGLIGAHRSRRDGDGTEFSSIRAFHSGDRLRRINWRVSLRQGTLHVESTRAEEDTAVLLIVDALADYGISEGVGRPPRAASTSRCARRRRSPSSTSRGGDRVSLRVLSPSGEYAGYGTGTAPPATDPHPAGSTSAPACRATSRSTRSTSGPRPARWSSCSARCSPSSSRAPPSGWSDAACR